MKRLVHYEETPDVRVALDRVREIKGWLRAKKFALIGADNPERADLSEAWADAGKVGW